MIELGKVDRFMVEKEDISDPNSKRVSRRTTTRNVELVDLGAKPRCLKFFIKAAVAPLMMLMVKKVCTLYAPLS